MANRSGTGDKVSPKGKEVPKSPRKASTPEARENQLINLAVNLAEEQMRNGTAKSQVIVHYLKLAATKEESRLKLEILEKEKALMEAKTAAISSQQRTEEKIQAAIEAMKRYSRGGEFDDED